MPKAVVARHKKENFYLKIIYWAFEGICPVPFFFVGLKVVIGSFVAPCRKKDPIGRIVLNHFVLKKQRLFIKRETNIFIFEGTYAFLGVEENYTSL